MEFQHKHVQIPYYKNKWKNIVHYNNILYEKRLKCILDFFSPKETITCRILVVNMITYEYYGLTDPKAIKIAARIICFY